MSAVWRLPIWADRCCSLCVCVLPLLHIDACRRSFLIYINYDKFMFSYENSAPTKDTPLRGSLYYTTLLTCHQFSRLSERYLKLNQEVTLDRNVLFKKPEVYFTQMCCAVTENWNFYGVFNWLTSHSYKAGNVLWLLIRILHDELHVFIVKVQLLLLCCLT